MPLVKNTMVAIAGLSAVGVAVWVGSSLMSDQGGGPPMPNSPVASAVITPTPANHKVGSPSQTQPVAQAVPASTELAALPSYLYFNYDHAPTSPQDLGNARQFPPARLRVTGHGDEAGVALLFSDDPKEAIGHDWQGDRYYFSMTLQQPVADSHQLDGMSWEFTASSSEREENANGIFLHGDQFHLEPISMQVHFSGQAPQLLVWISGEFVEYDTTNPNAEPRHCWVTGRVAPRVE